MQITKLPLSHFVEKLAASEPFCFARYGDGEWLAILGYYGLRNSNGCTMTQELSIDLGDVLRRQNPYYHTLLKIAKHERTVRHNGKEFPYNIGVIEQWLNDNGVAIPWYNGDVLLDANLAGNLFPLIEQIRGRRVLYVGNERLRGLNFRGAGFFNYITYVETPPTNAHSIKAELVGTVLRFIKKYGIDFIGWSAGLGSKVFIDEVFMKAPEVTQIDFGSSFDGYFEPLPHIKAMGRTGSRSYIRNGGYDWEKLKKANTGIE